MKFFGIIVLLGLASFCQGAPEERIERSALDNTLVGLVESLREILKTGNDTLGIPKLDPYQSEITEVAIDEDVATIEAKLKDLEINGLAGFTVDTLTFSLIGVRFTYCFIWPTINAKAKYTIDGTIANLLPIYGTGEFEIELTGASVCGNVGLSVNSNSYLFIRTSVTNVGLDDFKLRVTGMLNDEDVSALVSAVVTDMAPQVFNDFNTQINELVDGVIVSAGNELLGTMTLAELLAIIRG